jgi:hypothetical protein
MNPAQKGTIMHRLTRHIITAGAVSLAASLGAASPAAAEATTQGMPTRCYQWPLERLDVTRPAGSVMGSDQAMVTEGSPCRDLNVRAVLDVDGRPACRRLRVHWASGKVTPWRKVCSGWRVLAYDAREGEVFTVEVQGRPASVAVRS